jgi:hypothetical protein
MNYIILLEFVHVVGKVRFSEYDYYWSNFMLVCAQTVCEQSQQTNFMPRIGHANERIQA